MSGTTDDIPVHSAESLSNNEQADVALTAKTTLELHFLLGERSFDTFSAT